MDFFAEVENMAANAVEYAYQESDNSLLDAVERWKTLFNYPEAKATSLIKQQRADFTRKRISDSLWHTVQAQAELDGYDREAYEHMLEHGGASAKSTVTQAILSPTQLRAVYLVRLEGPIDTPNKIRIAGDLNKIPDTLNGTGEEEDAQFCQVDATAKHAIEQWCSAIGFKSTFVRITKAHKELSDTSIYPTLGRDATLPQNRPQDIQIIKPNYNDSFTPALGQYPVWYFFYGTLAEISRLRSVLSLGEDTTPLLHPASITGGKIKTWGGGKYNALIDDPHGNGRILGSAYKVMSKEHEDFLRLYETDAYEVVRCDISINTAIVPGCTFRYIGKLD